MEGWIKLYRKFCEWEWYNKSEMVHLFIHLLLNANQKDGEWRGVKIQRGQILTGLNSLKRDTKISFQTLRTCLKRLEKTKEINIQSTNQYSIITINNYEGYQIEKQATNKRTNKRLTSDQQATNNKQEEEEGKKEEKEESLIEIAWLKWKEYKKDEFGFKYKSELSEQASKTELINLSGNNEDTAIKIIQQSMAKGWKGFFKLNSNGKTTGNNGATIEELTEIIASKFGSK